MANATAKPCRRCYALIPLALIAAHDHWHGELEPVGRPDDTRDQPDRQDARRR